MWTEVKVRECVISLLLKHTHTHSHISWPRPNNRCYSTLRWHLATMSTLTFCSNTWHHQVTKGPSGSWKSPTKVNWTSAMRLQGSLVLQERELHRQWGVWTSFTMPPVQLPTLHLQNHLQPRTSLSHPDLVYADLKPAEASLNWSKTDLSGSPTAQWFLEPYTVHEHTVTGCDVAHAFNMHFLSLRHQMMS